MRVRASKLLSEVTRAAAFVLLLSLSGISTASAEKECEVQEAKYRMIEHPAISGGFVAIGKHKDWPSDLAFYIHSDATTRTFWFLFDQGSSAYIHLIATSDPTASGWQPPTPDSGSSSIMRSMEFYPASRELSFSFELPISGRRAPFRILVPELTEALKHSEPREDIPVAFFQLEGCRL